MDSYVLCVKDRQEPFSISYIGSIAAAAGYGFDSPNGTTNPDRSSIDCNVSTPNPRVLFRTLNIQAKCTYHHEPNETYIPFKIKKKNYDDIRLSPNPHLLVVVNVPRNINEWVFFNDKSTELRYNCYYMSLKGLGELGIDEETGRDRQSKIIHIPITNKLDVDRLSEIMNLLRDGKFILHNNEVIDL